MLSCKYCSRECKNNNSLKQHEIRCKLNDDKIEVKSNFIEYNRKLKNGEAIKEYTNHYKKAEILGLDKPIMSYETIEKMRISGRLQEWDSERRKRHSDIMLKTSKLYPDSYSSNNVCGRTKLIDSIDSFGNDTKLNGSWEYLVSILLNELSIKWTNKITEKIYYIWEGKERIYYPDFYLTEFDIYIEVKGYERNRDLVKWKSIKNRLIVFKKKEIDIIKGLISYNGITS
jgi:hypothetical protein